jgi:hypothetical protein
VVRTDAVSKKTTIVIVRQRFDIHIGADGNQLLAEEAAVLAFAGPVDAPEWILGAELEPLLKATAVANVSDQQAREFMEEALRDVLRLAEQLDKFASEAAERLLASHNRARSAVRLRIGADRVSPRLPVDILGVYVLLPGRRTS